MPGCRLTRTPEGPVAAPLPASSHPAPQAVGFRPDDRPPGLSSRSAGAASLILEGRSHPANDGACGEVLARAAFRPPQPIAWRPPAAARRHRTIPLLSESRISRIPLLIWWRAIGPSTPLNAPFLRRYE